MGLLANNNPLPKPAIARSQFATLRAPGTLWIPRVAASGVEEANFKPPGTPVEYGDSLLSPSSAGGLATLSPVTGTMGGVKDVSLLGSTRARAVLLETRTGVTTSQPPPLQPPAMEPFTLESAHDWLRSHEGWELSDAVDALLRAGVWADRWTSPDLAGQLQACGGERVVDTVVCNLLDADPSLGVNKACSRLFPVEIVTAVAVLSRMTRASRIWLAINAADDDPETWKPIERAAAALASDLRLVPLDDHYPQGDPTLLIYALTGRRLRPGRLSTDERVLMFDAAAALAIGRALLGGEPMLRVPMAIHDRIAVSENDSPGPTHLVTVPVGTPLGNVLAQLDVGLGMFLPGGPGHRCEIRAGAPLRQIKVTAQSIVAGGELGVFVTPREPDVNPDPCIRCGWCVEGCPVRVHPAGLLEAAQDDDLAEANRYGLDACIECGICSYVCPSNLPLLQSIRVLRQGG